MTKDEALRLALEALEVTNSLVDGYYLPKEKAWMPEIEEAITAVKAALEAKDEPVVWNEGVPAMLPKQKEGETFIVSYEPKQEAKDEPVAWMRTSGTGSPVVTEALLVEMPEMRWNFQQPLYTTSPQRKPLTIEQPKVRTGDCLLVGVCASEGHKIQPQRTWVGLTDEEMHECAGEYPWTPTGLKCVRAIETKLQEKNT